MNTGYMYFQTALPIVHTFVLHRAHLCAWFFSSRGNVTTESWLLPQIEALMRTMDADSGGSVSLAEFRVAVRQQQLSRAWPMLLEVADTNSSYAGEWPTKVLQAFQKGLFASASPNSTLSTHEESVVSGLESEQFRLALAEMEIR